MIFDEVQKIPEIFDYIKLAVDKDRDHLGKFVSRGRKLSCCNFSNELRIYINVHKRIVGRTFFAAAVFKFACLL